MKTHIRIILYTAAFLMLAVSLTFAITTHQHCITLKKEVKNQQTIIDSLLVKPNAAIECNLYVTDRSINKINGRYNKGTITMPQERRYILSIDSSKISVK